MKRSAISSLILSILIIISLSFASNLVTAETIGNITVYVRDQNGGDVMGNKNLIGNLTVELWYDGRIINTTNFFEGDKFIVFDVNHTGLYTVRAVAVLQFVNFYGCSCLPITNPTTCKCKKKCPNGTDTVDVDDKGIYTCIPGFFRPGFGCDYQINHTYIVANDVLTYVDEGESDNA